MQDLTGMNFGRWKVLNLAFRKNGKIYWHCQCQCDKKTEKDIQGQHLREGRSQSCGCLRKELMSQKTKINMIGQRFGHLTVIAQAENNKDRHAQWLCQCDCGNQKIILGKSLRNGSTQSCGCLKSKGEEKIIKLLKENNISFQTEKSFNNCRYSDTNFKAKFDFWVNNQYIIEYDGKQHFRIGGWNDENNLKIVQQHDNFKKIWCKEHNIPLIRIPYTHFSSLSIKDLLLETSEFKV